MKSRHVVGIGGFITCLALMVWWVAWCVEFVRGWYEFPVGITGVLVLVLAMGWFATFADGDA